MLASLLLLTAAAAAPDWRVVTLNTDDTFGRSIAFVDMSTFERKGDDIQMTMDLRLERPFSDGVDATRTRMHIDCAGKRLEIFGGDLLQGEVKRGPHPVEPIR